jgi:hypothetical protein
MTCHLELVLNELSLCDTGAGIQRAYERITRLARLRNALSALGAGKRLLHRENALEQVIDGGKKLKQVLFDRRAPEVERKLVFLWLDKAPPYVDDRLKAEEGDRRSIEAKHKEQTCAGLGLVGLRMDLAVSLWGTCAFDVTELEVQLRALAEGEGSDNEDAWSQVVKNVSDAEHVAAHQAWIAERVREEMTDGPAILSQCAELLPNIRFGAEAAEQVRALTGSERWFPKLRVHLQALNQGVAEWGEGSYQPSTSIEAVDWSPESQATLDHRRYGAMRDLKMPDGIATQRFSLHTKIRSDNKRVYFAALERGDGGRVVVIGHVGDHLPTVNHPT